MGAMLRAGRADPKLYVGVPRPSGPLHVVDIRDNSASAGAWMDHRRGVAYISRMTSLGTRLLTLFGGRLVGKDADGRSYYQDRRAARGARRVRRWVIYNPGEDPSAVPAEWWNWLHHADAEPLPASVRKPWQLPFEANRTGDPAGYRPPGSDYRGGHRPPSNVDYEAWSPDA